MLTNGQMQWQMWTHEGLECKKWIIRAQSGVVNVILHSSFRKAAQSQQRAEEWSVSASDSLEAFLLLINNAKAKTTSRQDPECQPMGWKILERETYQVTQAYHEVHKGSLDVVVTSSELLARHHFLERAQCFWIGLHCTFKANSTAVWKCQTFHYFLIWVLGHVAWWEKGFWIRKMTSAWAGTPNADAEIFPRTIQNCIFTGQHLSQSSFVVWDIFFQHG